MAFGGRADDGDSRRQLAERKPKLVVGWGGHAGYDAAALRRALPALASIAAAAALSACGSEGLDVPADDPNHAGAVLFAERCGGCHTLKAAGTQGSANRKLRNQGPNLDERKESVDDVLYAIRNGGFSGAIMPQNIVVGDDAEAVAEFVAEYAGGEVDRPPAPGEGSGTN
jgi:mono/diheme cytochrome c family protein